MHGDKQEIIALCTSPERVPDKKNHHLSINKYLSILKIPLHPYCERAKVTSWQGYLGIRELGFPTQIHLSDTQASS